MVTHFCIRPMMYINYCLLLYCGTTVIEHTNALPNFWSVFVSSCKQTASHLFIAIAGHWPVHLMMYPLQTEHLNQTNTFRFLRAGNQLIFS
jgi:hypothetical protein